jgi:hypothetical protein
MKVIFLRILFYFDYLLELGTSCKKIGYLKKKKKKKKSGELGGHLKVFSRSKKSKEFSPKKHPLLVLAYSQKYEGCLKKIPLLYPIYSQIWVKYLMDDLPL